MPSSMVTVQAAVNWPAKRKLERESSGVEPSRTGQKKVRRVERRFSRGGRPVKGLL